MRRAGTSSVISVVSLAMLGEVAPWLAPTGVLAVAALYAVSMLLLRAEGFQPVSTWRCARFGSKRYSITAQKTGTDAMTRRPSA